jgi:hypothetical protein
VEKLLRWARTEPEMTGAEKMSTRPRRNRSLAFEAKVVVEGNADERGTVEYNLALGQKRAEAVSIGLQAVGAKASQIETISYGEEKPWNKGKSGIYRSGKSVIIVSPDGNEYHYDRLKDGCRELGLTYTHMSSVNSGKKSNWRGWTVRSVNTG